MVIKFLKFANRPLPGWLTLAIFMVASASAAYTYTGGINVPLGATDTHAVTINSTVPANNVALGMNLSNTNAPNFLQFPNTSTNVGSNHLTNIGTSSSQTESGVNCTVLAVADSGFDQRLCLDRLGNLGIPATAGFFGQNFNASGYFIGNVSFAGNAGSVVTQISGAGGHAYFVNSGGGSVLDVAGNGNTNFVGTLNDSALTASQCLSTDGSKNIVSTGTVCYTLFTTAGANRTSLNVWGTASCTTAGGLGCFTTVSLASVPGSSSATRYACSASYDLNSVGFANAVAEGQRPFADSTNSANSLTVGTSITTNSITPTIDFFCVG